VSLDLDLYVVTDRALSKGIGHLEVSRRAVAGGADVIQLRDKELSSRDMYELAVEMREVVHRMGKMFIVNDRLDVALASNADGVHLGRDDLPVSAARSIAPNLVIGASVGSVEEASEAEGDGADYVAVSPVFDTPSKGDAGPGHGLEVLLLVRRAVSIPVIGIGGINRFNAAEVIGSGADGVAVISAVVSQADISTAAKELRAVVREAKACQGRGADRR
jgi:thiamine-phosphate pyrophosphorylase